MKILSSTLFILGIACTSLFGFERQCINNGWRFQLGNDSTWASPTFDDSKWRLLDLPHDWSIEGSFDKENPAGNDGAYLPTGIGWYRLKLKVESQKLKAGELQKLYFEGVYMNSSVYVNGELLGGHMYGFSSFWVDVTGKLKPGKNTIAVKVDNSAQKNCRWYTGSGIYRNVWLCSMNPNGIDDPWKLRVSTDKIYGISADGTRADSAIVRIAYEGRADELRTYRNIELWSPQHPVLYPIKVGGLSIEHGFRQIEFTTHGFLLNGQDFKIVGGCVHHDNGCLGAASFDDAERRKAWMMVQAGYNAVRTAHNPASEEFIRACDHLGLLVIDEAFDGWKSKKNKHDYHELLDEHWQEDIDALVLRDRNHPSVIAWSNGNEIWERKKIESITTSRKFARRMRELDPTRPVTQALCEVDEIFDPLAETLDVVGYNYLIDHAQKDHERCPERIIWQTESYSDSAFQSWQAVQELPYVIGDFVWTSIDYLGESGIGRAHYASDPADRGEHWQGLKWPWHGSYCGDRDFIGQRKPISYYRETLWNPNPSLYVAVREPNCYKDSIICTLWSTWPTTQSWNWPGHEGKPIDVEIYSRFPKVRLYLNDVLVGEKPTTLSERYKATFTLPYQPGKLRAVALNSDGSVAEVRAISNANEAADIRLSADNTTSLCANGNSLSFVTIELVDAEGTVLPNASDELKISVTGAGILQGVANADMTDMAPYAAHRAAGLNSATRKLWHGQAQAVIRTTHKAGKITLKVEGAGLSKTITLQSK